LAREEEILERMWPRLDAIPNLHLLADRQRQRLGVISFYIDELHYNLGVKLLNDRYGIQVRGGCSCAGTYGHYLLQVSQEQSQTITDRINYGDLSAKPGWIRMSIHPTTTTAEVDYMLDAIEDMAAHFQEWGAEYSYDVHTNEFTMDRDPGTERKLVDQWFSTKLV